MFLTRKAQGQKRVEALVEIEKQFCDNYNAKKEDIYFEFFMAHGMSMDGHSTSSSIRAVGF